MGSANKDKELNLSKEDLIKALQKMNRTPEDIKISSAMCYASVEMKISREIEFVCDKCGKTTLYKKSEHYSSGDNDILAEEAASIKTGLARTPYKIKVDTAGFCSFCNTANERKLVACLNCFNCGKEISFDIKNNNDFEKLSIFFIEMPISLSKVDSCLYISDRIITLGSKHDPSEAIRNAADYIHKHVFCEDCQKKILL